MFSLREPQEPATQPKAVAYDGYSNPPPALDFREAMAILFKYRNYNNLYGNLDLDTRAQDKSKSHPTEN